MTKEKTDPAGIYGALTPDPEADPGRPGRLGPDLSAASRAFVVELASGCDSSGGNFRGRVQHLATSDGGNFGSAEGLATIMRRVLARGARDGEA